MTEAEKINKNLRELQQAWYNNLDEEFKENNNKENNEYKYSAPFCFGVSENTIKEKNSDKPLIMYVGEEARGWWFDEKNQNNIEYIQGYGIAYYEKQLYGEYNDKVGLDDEDKKRINENKYSKFWKYIKGIIKVKDDDDENKYSICWNNVDKFHRIVTKIIKDEEKDITKTLTREDEKKLHEISPQNGGKSLLLKEILTVKPSIVIFTKYVYSVACDLGIEKNKLKDEINKSKEEDVIIDITKLCNGKEELKDTKVLFLKNHPNCRKEGFLSKAITQTRDLLKK